MQFLARALPSGHRSSILYAAQIMARGTRPLEATVLKGEQLVFLGEFDTVQDLFRTLGAAEITDYSLVGKIFARVLFLYSEEGFAPNCMFSLNRTYARLQTLTDHSRSQIDAAVLANVTEGQAQPFSLVQDERLEVTTLPEAQSEAIRQAERHERVTFWLLMSESHARDENFGDAAQALEQAAQCLPEGSARDRYLAVARDFRSRAGSEQQREAQGSEARWVKVGFEQARRGGYRLAAITFFRLAEDYPERRQVYFRRSAEYSAAQGEFDRANSYFLAAGKGRDDDYGREMRRLASRCRGIHSRYVRRAVIDFWYHVADVRFNQGEPFFAADANLLALDLERPRNQNNAARAFEMVAEEVLKTGSRQMAVDPFFEAGDISLRRGDLQSANNYYVKALDAAGARVWEIAEKVAERWLEHGEAMRAANLIKRIKRFTQEVDIEIIKAVAAKIAKAGEPGAAGNVMGVAREVADREETIILLKLTIEYWSQAGNMSGVANSYRELANLLRGREAMEYWETKAKLDLLLGETEFALEALQNALDLATGEDAERITQSLEEIRAEEN